MSSMSEFDKLLQMSSTDVYKFDHRLLVHVRSQEFLHEIGFRGPFKGMVAIKDIFEMLNRNIDVDIPEEYIQTIYNTICQYNRSAEIAPKGTFIKAELAEDRLEFQYKQKIIKKKLISEEKLNKMNPFLDDDEIPLYSTRGIFDKLKDSSNSLETKLQKYLNNRNKENRSIGGLNQTKKDVLPKRKKIFEIFGELTNNKDTLVNNEAQSTIYDDIEFDL